MSQSRDRYVPTVWCDCLIRVSSYPKRGKEQGWVDLNYISPHDERHHGRWRNRSRNAWRALRNNCNWTGVSLDTTEVAERLWHALSEAIREV